MSKRHIENLLSKEKKIYETNVKNYEKLFCKMNEKITLENVPIISGEILDPIACTPKRELLTNGDIHSVLQQIIFKLSSIEDKLDTLEQNQLVLSKADEIIVSNQKEIGRKLDEIEEKISFKPEMMAQTKALMECKVSIKRVEGSVCQITGETPDAMLDSVAVMLPLRSIASVEEMEEKLKDEEFARSTLAYLIKMKGASDNVGSIIRGIFTDDVLEKYNWDGRWEKQSLRNLTICNHILRDVFQKLPALDFRKQLRKCIQRSHNRIKQKKYSQK